MRVLVMQAQTELETGRSEVEKIMLTVNGDRTKEERSMYLAGYIECLHAKGLITEDTRGILYAEYCF